MHCSRVRRVHMIVDELRGRLSPRALPCNRTSRLGFRPRTSREEVVDGTTCGGMVAEATSSGSGRTLATDLDVAILAAHSIFFPATPAASFARVATLRGTDPRNVVLRLLLLMERGRLPPQADLQAHLRRRGKPPFVETVRSF